MIALALAALLAAGDGFYVQAQPGDMGRLPPEYPGAPAEPCQWVKVKSPAKEAVGSLIHAAISIYTFKDRYTSYADYERTRIRGLTGEEITDRVFYKGSMICITQEQKSLRITPIPKEPIHIPQIQTP